MPTQLFSTIRGKILAGSALLIVVGIALLTGLSVMGSYHHARDSAMTESRQLAEAVRAVKARLPAKGRAWVYWYGKSIKS